MQKYFIGELIKQRRTELKLTQEQLCEGICEPVTLSRLENGKQTPTMSRLSALLQRLGMPEHKYYALLSKNEMQISDLQTEITSCNVHRNSEEGLKKIEELEALADPDDLLIQQFILRSRVALGKLEHDQIIPYCFEEKLDLLLQAIALTSPRFNLNEIYKGLYSIDEIKVINQIALAYSDHGERKRAIDIYYQLLKYVETHFQNVLQSNGILPLIAYNYARELTLVGRYEDAIEIANLGWNACVQYGQYASLPATIGVVAECHHFLGMDENSQEYYRQAFYMYKVLGNKRGLNVMQAEAVKYFGSDFHF